MSDEVQPLFYNGNRVEFEDPEDPRAARLANGEDIGVTEPSADEEEEVAAPVAPPASEPAVAPSAK